ncbi:hypothetical protein WHX55_19075 [Pseudomonas fluorescens]|uniref:hypothetical protein n=1 Tax=Pseudomonas fluorescens TaxID=294 RepID=UPI00324CFF97
MSDNIGWPTLAVILAAGQGTRMCSPLPKVFSRFVRLWNWKPFWQSKPIRARRDVVTVTRWH